MSRDNEPRQSAGERASGVVSYGKYQIARVSKSAFSFLGRKKDRLWDVAVSPEVVVRVNLDYEYNYENIRLVLQGRILLLQKWVFENLNLPVEKQAPIIVPQCGIRLHAIKGAVDHLTSYIKFELNNSEYKGKGRFLFIPLNTGGHWVSLVLYVSERNHISTAVYINSVTNPKGAAKEILPEDNILLQQIRAADSNFKRPVYQARHWIQPGVVACGVLTIENGIESIKAIYAGPKRYAFKPALCEDAKIAEIRAQHIIQVGIGGEFDSAQRENKQFAEGSSEHAKHVGWLSTRDRLNKNGIEIISLVRQLPHFYEKSLTESFKVDSPDEEHKSHMGRLRDTIRTLIDTIETDPFDLEYYKEPFDKILRIISGGECSFEKPFDKDGCFPILGLGDRSYEQLNLIGRALSIDPEKHLTLLKGVPESDTFSTSNRFF